MKKLLKNQWVGAAVTIFVTALSLAFIYSFMAEAVRIGSFGGTFEWLSDHKRSFVIGAFALAIITAALFFAVRRAYIAAAAVGLVIFLGSFANFYKTMYRGDPLLPVDFAIALDAAKISGELKMTFTFPMIVFLGVILLISVLLYVFKVRLSAASSRRGVLINTAIGALIACGLLIYLPLTVWNTKLMAPIGVKVIPGDAALCYKNSGFLTGYLLYIDDLKPKMPPNYSKEAVNEAAKELKEPLAQQKPDVFVIMLESYYHLENYPMAFTEDITQNYRRLAQEGVFGYFLSDKYSGGTADMEFGALTGFSTSHLPTGSIPYSEYVSKRETPSYPKYLKRHGYKTIAVHPYNPTIYKRDAVYPNLGFDEFITQDSFSEKDIKGVYVSDKAVMDKIIESYESAREIGPVFIHAVTMQNHIPNLANEYDSAYAANASCEGVPEQLEQSLVSVATGLRDADAAMGYLTDYLKKQKRPAVVLFFGDHQTSIGSYNGKELLDYAPQLKALPPEAYTLATHKVPYLMWANYETENKNKNGGLIPPYQLIAQLTGRYELVRSAWFDYLYQTSKIIPGTNLGYTISVNGGLEGAPSAIQQSILDKQKMLQYDALLGQRFAKDIF